MDVLLPITNKTEWNKIILLVFYLILKQIFANGKKESLNVRFVFILRVVGFDGSIKKPRGHVLSCKPATCSQDENI